MPYYPIDCYAVVSFILPLIVMYLSIYCNAIYYFPWIFMLSCGYHCDTICSYPIDWIALKGYPSDDCSAISSYPTDVDSINDHTRDCYAMNC